MIDVLLPYYGDVALMKQAVQSVRAQTHRDWRLVVIDDCHPDPEIGRWLGELDDARIEYHRNERNLGPNANYVKALSLARAPWFVMMGADDVMGARFLELVDGARRAHPDAGVITCRVRVIDEVGRPHRPIADRVKTALAPRSVGPVVLSGEAALVSVLTGNWTYFPSLVWRRELVDRIGFRAGFDVVQDLALLVDVLAAGGSLVRLGDAEFSYRRHANSDSARKTSDGGARFAEERAYFARVAGELHRRGLRRAARAARWHLTSRAHALTVAADGLRSGDRARAVRMVRHACDR